MAIIDVPRNIGLKLGGAVATTKPKVAVESTNACFLTHIHWGSCSDNCVYTKETILCSHPLRSKESATTWSIGVMHTYLCPKRKKLISEIKVNKE